VCVLPYPQGRQAPAPDPAARVAVIGRRPEHTAPDLARALLQGLCLQARWLLDEQQRLAGAASEEPVIALGGALLANPAWLRLKAHVTPRALRVVAEREAVAVGAALVAAATGTGSGRARR
jgi:sugar (pentulose or hexulose) kinase